MEKVASVGKGCEEKKKWYEMKLERFCIMQGLVDPLKAFKLYFKCEGNH